MLQLLKRVLIDSHSNDLDEYINLKNLKQPKSDYMENQRQKALDYLGDKWILKNPISRKGYTA